MTAYSTHSDQELLSLVAQGDQEAFNTLFTRHWESLYKSAFYVLRDPEASKDILQNIFIWLWDNRQTLQIQSLQAYLRVAVKFGVANHIHARKIRDSFYKQLAQTPFSDLSPSSEELSEIRELTAIIQNAIGSLPDRCRNIYLMKRDQQLSNREIAERLGISIKTVENQMTIALRRIRSLVDNYLVMLLAFSCACLLSP